MATALARAGTSACSCRSGSRAGAMVKGFFCPSRPRYLSNQGSESATMKRSRWFSGAVVALTCSGLVVPQSASAAVPAATSTVSAVITDVALKDGGLLVGKVVNEQGTELAGASVS